MRKLITWFIGLGASGEINQYRFRTGALTNITFLVLSVISFGAVFIVHLPVGDRLAGLVSAVFGVCYLTGIGVQARGWHMGARAWLVLLVSLHYVTICTVMGPYAGVEIYGLAFAGSPFLLFARKERMELFASLAVLAMALIVGQLLMYSVGPLGTVSDHSFAASRIFAFMAMAVYLGAVIGYYRMAVHRAEDNLLIEKGRTEDLLANILPEPISARLKRLENPIADRFEEVTVMFADLAGFTNFANRNPASEVVRLLNEIFCAFDEMADHYRLEKIKTIGDAYMIAAGLPGGTQDAAAAAEMAQRMQQLINVIQKRDHYDIGLRVGIHVGSAVAGVIGKRKFTYDLWGDTVNLASRLQEAAPVGKVLVSAQARERLDGRFAFEPGGIMDIRGIGRVGTFFLLGAADIPDDGLLKLRA